MVCRAGHGYYKEGLNEDTNGESVHGEACGIDLDAEEVNHALCRVGGGRFRQGQGAIMERIRHIRARCARLRPVILKPSSFSS